VVEEQPFYMAKEKSNSELVKKTPEKLDASPTPSSTPPKKFKIPRLRWIALGIILIVVAVLVVDYIRVDVLRTPVVFGKILDENGEPFDGAKIVGNGKIAVTRPDGIFRIDAKKDDPLTVSAFGYTSTVITGNEPAALLERLPPANIRVVVVDPEYNRLSDALVVRLDPNTSAPVEELITDSDGGVTFVDILSGQAVFVALHPDYGMGWVETAVEVGGYARPVVQLQKIQVNESKKNADTRKLIKSAYAQNDDERWWHLKRDPTGGLEVRADTWYEFTDVREVGDNLYDVSVDSITMTGVSFNSYRLKQYIEESKLNNFYHNMSTDKADSQRIHKALMEKGFISPIQTVRIVPTFRDTSYEIEPGVVYGYDPATGKPKHTAMSVDERTQSQYRVEIRDVSNAETMAFIERYNAKAKDLNDPSKTFVVTSWAELPMAESFVQKNGGAVKIESPHMTVCCKGPRSEVSSNNTKPSSITTYAIDNNKLSYIYNPVTNESRYDYTASQNALNANPRLEYKDKNGQTRSLLDIDAPDPVEAPGDFLNNYYESKDQASNAFFEDDPQYNKRWHMYLADKLHNWLEKSSRSSTDFKDEIVRELGLDRAYGEYRGIKPTGYKSPLDTSSNTSTNSYTDDWNSTIDDEVGSGEETTEEIPPEEEITVTPETPTKQPSSDTSSCPPGAQFTCSR